MATKYTPYSDKRSEIMQQVRRVERKGFVVPAKYYLPKVSELRKMSAEEQSKIMASASRMTTAGIGRYSKRTETVRTKTGKVKIITVSYNKAKKKTRAASAKAGAETRRKRKRGTGAGGGDYRSPTEPPVKEPAPTPEEPEFIIDEKGNIYNAETGEVIHTADRHTIEDTEGNIFDYDTGELLGNRNQYDLYQQAKDEGDVPRGQTFEDWLESVAEDGGAQSYIEGIVEVLDMVNPSVADYVRTESEKYRNANPAEFDKRFIEREGSLPQINDIFGSPRRGSGDISVNYGAIANLMKIITGKSTLSGSQMRAIGRALDQDDYE